MSAPVTFGQLAVGDSFDWIDGARPGSNSFFDQCVKISARRYQSHTGAIYHVGSVRARVFHVNINGELIPGAEK